MANPEGIAFDGYQRGGRWPDAGSFGRADAHDPQHLRAIAQERQTRPEGRVDLAIGQVSPEHLAAARANGKLRTEGKTYVMREGDVVEFKFNVSK